MEAFDQTVFLKFLAAFLALVNPLYGLPIFISLTEGFTPGERRMTALVVTLTVAVTGLISVLIGEEILAVFGIGIPAFRIAGGLVIFAIGMSMLNAEEPSAGDSQAAAAGKARKRNVAVVPLAIPLTIGPGAIVTCIVFAHQIGDGSELFTLASAVGVVSLILGVALFFAVPITRLLGATVLSIVTRIMAIVLTAVAVEMILTGIADGVREHLPELLTRPATG